MKEFVAFLLPPAVALAGARINRIVLGKEFELRFGGGMRFGLGLASGMLVFTQTLLLGAIAGVNAAAVLAWLALLWGAIEFALLLPRAVEGVKGMKFQMTHFWLFLFIPVIIAWWVFGRLSTLEGTLEFDANVFWVFKSKILYLEQGQALLARLHDPSFAYAHWDYPLLVPDLYVLGYGAYGGVNEFINKVWPFWMMVGLCLAILSLARTLNRPHPLPIAAVIIICFLPGTLYCVHMEGGTFPMVFYVGLTTLLIVHSLFRADSLALAAAIMALAGCAMTKFEGIVYTGVWFCALLPMCWRRAWLRQAALGRAFFIGLACWAPYIFFRFLEPVAHPESGWWRAGIASLGMVLHRFPQVWLLTICNRFFYPNFYTWEPSHGWGLSWTGHLLHWTSFCEPRLLFLPWLTLLLLTLSLWKKERRFAVLSLTAVVMGVLTILAFVISCLTQRQADLSEAISSNCEPMGRYSYPFFVAWFLGILVTWFADADALPVPATGKSQSAGELMIPNHENQNRTMTLHKQLGGLVTFFAMATGVFLIWAQWLYNDSSSRIMSLSQLNKRASFLRQITDPIRRDTLCTPLGALGRLLDHELPKNTRIFVVGMIGKTNASSLGNYFILRNYLFPRQVEVSLDGKALFHEGWFDGVPCNSINELRTKGFQFLIRPVQGEVLLFDLITMTPLAVEDGPNGFRLVPITPTSQTP